MLAIGTLANLGALIALAGSIFPLVPWIPPITRWLEAWKDIPQLRSGRRTLVQDNVLDSDQDGFQVVADYFKKEYDLDGEFVEIRYHPGYGTNGSPTYMLTVEHIDVRQEERDIVGEPVGDFGLLNPQLMQEENNRWQSIQRRFAAVAITLIALGVGLQASVLLS